MSSSSSSTPAVDSKELKTTTSEGTGRPSLVVQFIRHAESRNNEVYRDARYIFRGGTPEFDEPGWYSYVDQHRSPDPFLSKVGVQQRAKLGDYLVPHLTQQASQPVQVIVSPMLRTLETIKPTLYGLAEAKQPADVVVNAFYHESEGCHSKDTALPGMNRNEITKVLATPPQPEAPSTDMDGATTTTTDPTALPLASLDFVGFPEDPSIGWYAHATSAETRAASEVRAAKFYLWLCEHLDQELEKRRTTVTADIMNADVFDAGVAMPGEEDEDEHDKHASRKRRRRTYLLVGHGDFMSLVLKRVIAGFGHSVEQEGIPHRSALVHFNTGITEVEYFGQGRFLVMGTNATPHLQASDYRTLRSGGSLKDGWSYLIPDEPLNTEVKVAFDDDELEEHVREQTQALKSLYLRSDQTPGQEATSETAKELAIEQQADAPNKVQHLIVHRGLRVVGCATYHTDTGVLTDVAIRPSAKARDVLQSLLNSVPKDQSRKSLVVVPRTNDCQQLFQELGFDLVEDASSDGGKVKLERKLEGDSEGQVATI